ncbi:MAG: restriction endonuclease EcoRI subunit [Cytophagaceae bacterium]|jgi:hypothetical protein|nr:restriction endonuclease EcoRI subunit [Cytophagaceae bacterium]
MIPLNLPPYESRIVDQEDGKYIFDIIRKKYIKLLPEEWVRQNFIHFLIHHRHYPSGLFRIERGAVKAYRKGRTDIQVWNNEGKPLLMVECKSFELDLNKKAILQASVYNHDLRARFLVLTNGLKHFAFEFFEVDGVLSYKPLADIPFYGRDLKSEI